MAYKATEQDGKWYVGRGTSFYPSTECDTFEQAEREALVWEMQDLYNKSRRAYDAGVEKGYFDPDQFLEYLC